MHPMSGRIVSAVRRPLLSYVPRASRLSLQARCLSASPSLQSSTSKWWGWGPSESIDLPEKAPRIHFVTESEVGWESSVAWHDGYLFVMNASGNGKHYTATDLRDICHCPICRDPSSGQRNYATTEIPLEGKVTNVVKGTDGLIVSIDKEIPRLGDGGHDVILPYDTVYPILNERALKRDTSHTPSLLAVQRAVGVQHWDRESLAKETRKIDYDEFMQTDNGRWDVLADLVRLGIAFVKNVPRDEESVVHLTTRIANIRETFYGRTFDVRAKPDAENVAYTSGYLGLHQDLLYLNPSPQIQVLHCMDNSCQGGESLFSDADRVGRMLWAARDEESATVRRLLALLIPYGYNKGGHHYFRLHPVMEGAPGHADAFGTMNWSPPFMADHGVPFQHMDRWIKSARVFERLVNEEDAVYSYKMEPGECVLFDNKRVLHGRNAFDAEEGGSRWLRGAYIAPDDFVSAIMGMPKSHRLESGSQWNPVEEERKLRGSKWYEHMLDTIREVNPPEWDEPSAKEKKQRSREKRAANKAKKKDDMKEKDATKEKDIRKENTTEDKSRD